MNKHFSDSEETMRYQCSTGLSSLQILDLVEAISETETSERSPQARPPVLGLFQQVKMTLISWRQNITQRVLGDLFEISQSTVCRVLRHIAESISAVLDGMELSLEEAYRGANYRAVSGGQVDTHEIIHSD